MSLGITQSNVLAQLLGTAIQSFDVRLVTSRDDQYCWRALPHIRHIFLKQLSDLSLSAFKDRC
ncbi:hypothetical protein V8F06_004970 [Rhypophila decipiens]